MSKLALRLSILVISLYMITCYIVALASGINIWSHTYTVLLELCLCICISAQGKYHCKYMKWTLYGITLADALTSLDELFDFVPYNWLAFSPAIIITIGLLTTTTLAIRHYHRVRKLKRQWNQISQSPQSYKKSEGYSLTASDESTTTNATKTTLTA